MNTGTAGVKTPMSETQIQCELGHLQDAMTKAEDAFLTHKQKLLPILRPENAPLSEDTVTDTLVQRAEEIRNVRFRLESLVSAIQATTSLAEA